MSFPNSPVNSQQFTLNGTTYIYNSAQGTWTKYSLGFTGQGGGSVTNYQLNNLTISANASIPSGQSAVSVGPLSIASGVTITVPSGSKWVVL